MSFRAMLEQRWQSADSLLCVGIDPDPSQLPHGVPPNADGLLGFCIDIIDATAAHACAFKPQIAHFAAGGHEAVLEQLIAHVHARHPGIPVILDAKRGDIGSTARHYATEAFDRYRADAVTLNPYMGRDSAEPFLERADRGCIILCHTSNPGAGEFQELAVDGQPLYLHVARAVARDWNVHGNCGLVIGATYPAALAQVRAEVGDMPLLIPGIGAQGGDLQATLAAGLRDDRAGVLINASRSIAHAGNGSDSYAAAARAAAAALRQAINAERRRGGTRSTASPT